MSDLKVALVQTEQIWENKEGNFNHFSTLLKRDLKKPVDVIVFPEMFHTGFTMNTKDLAETMTNSKGIDWLTFTAKTYKALCLASLIVQDNGHFFNRMVAVFPEGHVEYYDKIHLFSLAGEDLHYQPGKSRKIIEFRGWKINLQVCYDLRFPENSRNSIDRDGNVAFDLLVYVANWPERRISHWDKLLPARAIENQTYVLAVNRVGLDANDLKYNGSSQVLSFDGSHILDPQLDKEGVFITNLNKPNLDSFRKQLAFLKDRVF